jgi:glycosyltransferase involved in cell wall biosynthesis
VVAARASCLPEIYADAALYFSPNDSEALAGLLHRLLTEPTLRTDLIAKGYTRAGEFSWSATAHQTVSLYQSL